VSDVLKLKYKVGEIEFEAEGPAEAVEQQRINFMNAVLPDAVEAMARIHAAAEHQSYVKAAPQALISEASGQDVLPITLPQPENDFSRTSLASFLKNYGTLNEQDFVLFSAYFDENRNGKKSFSIDDVKRYYSEARRAMPKNPSVSTFRLAEKGYIMDAPKPENAKSGNYYMLTDAGIEHIESYVPKEDSGEKKKARSKARKVSPNISEEYAAITADDLNIKNYPAVKNLSRTKEQVIMAMYIVTNEKKGEWFSVDDIVHLLVDIFEVPANRDKVNGVFQRNKSMFTSEQDANNKKALRHKLLSGAKELANAIIHNATAE